MNINLRYYNNYIIHENGDIESKLSHKILKHTCTRTGYHQVMLYDHLGGHKKFLVHRLVAETFIPNPEGLPQVNHKDMNKDNNNADNLEWCDAKYNLRHARSNGRNIYTKERNSKIRKAKTGVPMSAQTKLKLSKYMRSLPKDQKTAITHRLHKNKPSPSCPLCYPIINT